MGSTDIFEKKEKHPTNKKEWETPEFRLIDINETRGGPAPATYDDTFVHS